MRTLFFVFVTAAVPAVAAPPQVLDDRLILEQVAAEPDIVTPTGIAVDAKGRIFCVENHTHQTAAGYKGPKSDRIRVLENLDDQGKAQKITTFAEGFRDAMSLTFSHDGVLYLATRAAIHRFEGNQAKAIIRLETKGNYPHNGLCGFTWDSNGDLIFGLGENLGESYQLVGSDGSSETGGGEGGSMYRCKPDGSSIRRIATGFWNPYGMTFDAFGRLFAVDNDPDAKGPCRLLHVIQGGDYGYRFRYGRKGTHPFQAWNGELPGALPMVAGTSEAPSGVIACDHTALPKDYTGELLITSWGDHTIERFQLTPRGASFSATAKAIIRGDDNFRPVAFAIAPDGSVVFSDWVKKDYPVHGHGRIWRLRAKAEHQCKPRSTAPRPVYPEKTWASIVKNSRSAEERMAAILQLQSAEHLKEIVSALADADPFVASAAMEVLGKPGQSSLLLERLGRKASVELRLGILLTLRRTGDADGRKVLPQFLADADPAIRRAALQWVAEERLTEYADQLEAAAAKSPVTRELFESWLAARELLDGKKPRDPGKETVAESYVAAILQDEKRPVVFRTIALRMLRHDHPVITPGLLSKLFEQNDEALRLEVVRALMLRPDGGSQTMLRKLAQNAALPIRLRALAAAGLAYSVDQQESRAVLEKMASNSELKAEVERSLAGPSVAKSKHTPAEWRTLLSDAGDAAAGERVFFHPNGPGCYRCHRVESRGYPVGPDLTFIGRSLSREKLIDSILEPSKEIAPMFTTWRIMTQDGRERVGTIVGETHDSMVMIADAQGNVAKLHRTAIEERHAVPVSIMPDDVANRMTPKEFRDLLAYLESRKQ